MRLNCSSYSAGGTYPIVSSNGLLVDRENHLWILRSEPFATTARHWDVFAPSGSLVAAVRAPGNGATEIGSDYILGVETDSLGGQRVVDLPLARR